MDLKSMYAENAEFREYVNRYASTYMEGIRISPEEALEHAVVREYALWLTRR